MEMPIPLRVRAGLRMAGAVSSPCTAAMEDTMTENGPSFDDPIGHLDPGTGTTFADWIGDELSAKLHQLRIAVEGIHRSPGD